MTKKKKPNIQNPYNASDYNTLVKGNGIGRSCPFCRNSLDVLKNDLTYDVCITCNRKWIITQMPTKKGYKVDASMLLHPKLPTCDGMASYLEECKKQSPKTFKSLFEIARRHRKHFDTCRDQRCIDLRIRMGTVVHECIALVDENHKAIMDYEVEDF